MATHYSYNKHPQRYRAFCFNIGFLLVQLVFFISILLVILSGSSMKLLS